MECFISKPKRVHIEPIIILDSNDDGCNADNAYGDNGRRSHMEKNSSEKFKSSHENNDHDNDGNKNNYGNDDNANDKNNYKNGDAEVCIVMPPNFTDATSNTSNTHVNSSDTDPEDNS